MPRQRLQVTAVIAGAVVAALALLLVLRFVNAGSDSGDAKRERDAHRAAATSLQQLAQVPDAAPLSTITTLSATAQQRLSQAGAARQAQRLAQDTASFTAAVQSNPAQAATARQAAQALKSSAGALLTAQQHAADTAAASADAASSRRTWALRELILLCLLTGLIGAAAIAGLTGLVSPMGVQATPATNERTAVRRPPPRAPSAGPLSLASVPPRLSSSEPAGGGRAFTATRAPGGLRAKLAVTTSAHPGTMLDAATHNGLVIYAGSMIGPEHRAGKHFVPREDAYALAPGQDSGVIVVAVADGVGSARNSHAAALMATELAVAQLRLVSSAELETWYHRPQLWRDRSQLLMAGIARQLTPARVDERARLIELATSSSTSSQRLIDPATTLVVAIGVIDGDGVRVLWAGVGDSQVGVLAPGARQLSWTSEEGDSSSGTRALPMDADHVICSQYFLPPGHAFLLTTDGCEKVLSLDPGTVPLLHQMVARPGDTGRLLELLHRNPPGAGDDRTLVLFAPTGGLS